ncbi:MAG: hypothetical protein GY913_10145 [Proteobacteria bacterium]|nr:hypothetical protein [Pseudomonadota bacterium]MCP4917274.1 hypothetical protein [Pseudomonadota bacterium]
MSEKIIDVADGFWNIRGVFRLGGVVDIGTHASLVRLGDGRFVLLDAYTLPAAILARVRELTGDRGVDALVNLHPFHTVHVKRAHTQFPEARLFGSARHVAKAPGLLWEDVRVEDPGFAELFGPDLEFSIPDGVDFISADENVHFSSVLAYHRPSRTMHVDDTFTFLKVPLVGGLGLHPTLGKALKRSPGSAAAFRRWGAELVGRWGDARSLCAAHAGTLLDQDDLAAQLRSALAKGERTLRKHERRHGA